MSGLIEQKKSAIIACDIGSLEELGNLVNDTCDLPGIGGYKVGLQLVIPFGLGQVMDVIDEYTRELPVIYDPQKGATDIPEMGTKFAKAVKFCDVQTVILFPLSGPATEEAWIKACQAEGLTVLVGGEMTQPKFLESEGGFISNFGPQRIYEIAAENGVTDFVVPGNRVGSVRQYRQLLEQKLGRGNFTLYAPGFISQGGNITDAGKWAGDNWHAIVGRDIYGADDIRAAAIKVTSQIVSG